MKEIYRGERIVGLAELKKLFLDLLPRLKWIFISAFVFFFCVKLFTPALFTAKATFKTAGDSQQRPIPYKELFIGAGFVARETVSLPVLESDALLGDVIGKLGLQMSSQKSSVVGNLLENLSWEFSKKPSEKEQFAFADVKYSGEIPKKLRIRVLGSQKVVFLGSRGNVLGEGKCGETFAFEGVQGRLVNIPSKQKEYTIEVLPLVNVTSVLRKKITAKKNKLDPNILNLECTYSDRSLAAQIINEVIASYERFLKEENAQKMQLQIDYLKMRENQLMEGWNTALKDYEGYLKENLSGSGYLNCAQEIAVLAQSQNTFTNKIFDIDLELKRLGFPGSMHLVREEPLLHAKGDSPLLGKEQEVWAVDMALKDPQVQSVEEEEFKDLNLDAARALYKECHQQKDALELKQVQYRALLEKMKENTFDVSSLTNILTDPVAQDIVHKAALVAMQLKDSGNRSLKEQELLAESLDVQKRFITSHLQDTIAVGNLQTRVIVQKINSLSRCITAMLGKEKGLLQHKMEEIAHEMEGVPQRWRQENLLSFKKEIGMNLLESIAGLTESRNMELNLFQGGVKSLDLGVPPLKPNAKHLFRNSILFGIAAALMYYFFHFARRLSSGFALTHETMRLLGLHAFGKISSHVGKDLEGVSSSDMRILREASIFLSSQDKGSCLSTLIVGGKAPNFSKNLAQLLALEGLKVLLIDYLAISSEGQKGLNQYLKGEIQQLPIHSHKGFDHIYSGGWSRYAPEQLKSPHFLEFLKEAKTRYDRIVFYTEVSAQSFGEVSAALTLCECAVVAIAEETKEDLQPFFEWEGKFATSRLGFVSLS